MIGDGAFRFCKMESVDFSRCNRLQILEGGAFYECVNLKAIELPDSVRTIGVATFHTNYSLENAYLGKSLEVVGEASFYDCTALGSLYMPDTVQEIGRSAFLNTQNLQGEMHINAKIIGEYAFTGCKNLNFTFGEDVETIERYAFADTGIVDLYLHDAIKLVGEYSFAGCEQLKTIVIKGNSIIDECAFSPVLDYQYSPITALKSVDISASIIKNSFAENQNLSTIILREGLTEIGQYAFAATAVSHLEIPSSVKTIGEIAFVGCEKLESVVLNEGLEHIGVKAFAGCALTSVTLPKSLKSIGADAFGYELSLESIYYNGTLDDWKKVEIVTNEDLNNPDDPIITSPIFAAQFFYVYDGEEYILIDKNLN